MNRGRGGNDSVALRGGEATKYYCADSGAQSSTDNRSGYVVDLAGNIYDPLPSPARLFSSGCNLGGASVGSLHENEI